MPGALLLALLASGCLPGHSPFETRRGKVFRRLTARVRGLDPVKISDVASARAVGLVYEGLLQYAYDARPYRLEPCLAEAMPVVSDDGLTYTFRLRGDVRFQDDPCFGPDGKGRPVTAEDFVYSIKRLADANNASPGYWTLNDRVVGLDAFREASTRGPADYDRPVDGLLAPDARTVRIRLKRPYPQLLWILAMNYTFVVPREAVERYGSALAHHPVGTGAYRLAGWRRNYRLDYVRHRGWRPPAHADASRLGRLDGVRLYVMDDSTTRWLAFLAGQIDLYSDISRDTWDVVVGPDLALDEDLVRRGITLHSIASLDTFYVGLNMDDPVLGPNRPLRQALNCAFDAQAWVKLYNGRVLPARGPIPPGIDGTWEGEGFYRYDLQRARDLLKEAGYPGGIDPATGRRLELTLELGRTDTETRESTELLTGFMSRIGLSVKANYNNWPAFLEKVGKRQAQMFRVGWLADYPDAENFLQLFYGPNQSPGPNRSNYGNPEFDRLYERVREMGDSPERTALYRRMARIVVQDAPWLFMSHRLDYNMSHARLRGYRPHDFPYGMEIYYDMEGALP